MKTEPTEALRAMANDLKYNTGVVQSNIKLVIEESFISGVKYGQSSPKIKQLKWENSDSCAEALTKMGKYLTYTLDANAERSADVRLYFMGTAEGGFEGTIDEAKAAAQADFEKRIKECLE